MKRLFERKEWQFFAVLFKADRLLAAIWYLILFVRGVLPAVFALGMGLLVLNVQSGERIVTALVLTGGSFLLLQILAPIHLAVGANLGDRTAAWLYDRLGEACIRPAGMEHLEDPTLTGDLTLARHFDLGMMGPPLSISMDFIAAGLVEMIAGLASAIILVWFHWWAPLLLSGAWLATHWLCATARSGTIDKPKRSVLLRGIPNIYTASPSIRRARKSCGCSAWPAG
jgi:hypothetical protein